MAQQSSSFKTLCGSLLDDFGGLRPKEDFAKEGLLNVFEAMEITSVCRALPPFLLRSSPDWPSRRREMRYIHTTTTLQSCLALPPYRPSPAPPHNSSTRSPYWKACAGRISGT